MFLVENLVQQVLLDLLIAHLDLAIHYQRWEARDKVGALTLSTVDERVLGALLLEVILLLCAPRARVAAVHGHTWTLGRLVLFGWHKLSLLGHAGVGDVGALGAQPPLVDVKGENADDHSECDTHDDGIAIHFYCTLGKKKSGWWRRITRPFKNHRFRVCWILLLIIYGFHSPVVNIVGFVTYVLPVIFNNGFEPRNLMLKRTDG